MSCSDPIADMLARLSNAQRAGHQTVEIPSSKIKENILSVLKREGYILDFSKYSLRPGVCFFKVQLKYYQGRPVIDKLKRISKPGRRVYVKNTKVPSFYNGLGVVIISTSNGILTDRQARQVRCGGEVLLSVM